jgi:hypothetical protein
MTLIIVVRAKVAFADDFIDNLAAKAAESLVIVDKGFILATLAAMITTGLLLNHAASYLRT